MFNDCIEDRMVGKETEIRLGSADGVRGWGATRTEDGRSYEGLVLATKIFNERTRSQTDNVQLFGRLIVHTVGRNKRSCTVCRRHILVVGDSPAD